MSSGTKDLCSRCWSGLLFSFSSPHPWNGVGFVAAMIWEIVTILYCLWWSHRQAPQVGTSTLVGRGAVVVERARPGQGQATGRNMASPLRECCRAWSPCLCPLGRWARPPRRAGTASLERSAANPLPAPSSNQTPVIFGGRECRTRRSTCRIHLPHELSMKAIRLETAWVREPTPGLQPGTPSLRVKCSAS